jgi:peptidoglycan/LPS O-acetylase OafA/YrhL
MQDGTPKGLMLARYGVSIFFVLSGFLITYLLQQEKESGKIHIKKFYIRRILRIWPLYYLYLGIALIITFLTNGYYTHVSLLLYIFYAANIPFILGTSITLVAHFWSLGVEEQFYLFWPWMNRIRIQKLIWTLVFLIILLVGSRIFLHYFRPGSLLESVLHITRFHNMMIGALGAILYRQSNKLFLKISDNWITQSVSWLILFLVLINQYHVASVIDNEIICVVALFLIIGQIRIHHRVLNLETPVLNFLGRISYGIYVYHPIIIFFGIRTLNFSQIQTPFNYIFIYLAILSGTILTAYLSYTFFEIHFLNLKKRFEVVRSLKS